MPGKLVMMEASEPNRSATGDSSAAGTAQVAARVALVLGANAALGQQMLALLVDDARYAWVHVGIRQSLGLATPKYRPWVIGRSTIVADDAFVFLSDLREPVTPSPVARFGMDDLLRAAALARDAGVRRLLVIAAIGALHQAADPWQRLANEPALTTMGFETMVLVRAGSGGDTTERGGLKQRAGALGRAVSAIMRPATLQAVRPAIEAAALLDLFFRCGAGVHVLGARELCGLPSSSRF